MDLFVHRYCDILHVSQYHRSGWDRQRDRLTVYAKPLTFTLPIKLLADTEMLEGFCENHHASRDRMASTRLATVVQVPPATLSQYVGTYDTEENGMMHFVHVTLDEAGLWFDYDGKGKELLLALSPTRFSWTGSIVEFSSSPAGAMAIAEYYAEGTERGIRRTTPLSEVPGVHSLTRRR